MRLWEELLSYRRYGFVVCEEVYFRVSATLCGII